MSLLPSLTASFWKKENIKNKLFFLWEHGQLLVFYKLNITNVPVKFLSKKN